MNPKKPSFRTIRAARYRWQSRVILQIAYPAMTAAQAAVLFSAAPVEFSEEHPRGRVVG